MASLRSMFLLLAFTSRFFSCSSERGRKELRDKETYLRNVIKLFCNANKLIPHKLSNFHGNQGQAHGAEEKNSGASLHSENVFMNRTQLTTEMILLQGLRREFKRGLSFLKSSKPLHIMHYELEEGKQKLDYFGNESTLGLSERLMATVSLYLSNVTRGGKILFPDSAVKNKIWSDCTKVTNIQRPIKGNAILFFTLHPNASPDESGSHARCPVLEGEMWCAAKFFQIREVKKEKNSIESVGDECTDEDEDCPHWAATGECQRNSLFMVGSPDYYGTCRKSCEAC